MTAAKLNQFGGMLPAWDPKLLPEGQSANSVNSYVFSGALQGWRAPKLLRALKNGSAAFAYRIPTITVDANGVEHESSSITGPAIWLEFGDIDTNVVRSQVANDTFRRFYWAAPSLNPPQYNTYNRIAGGSSSFNLGITPPGCAPTVTVTGGGNSVTLGPTASDGNLAWVNANTIYLIPILPSGNLSLADIQIMFQTTSTTARVAAVIFEDLNPGGNVPTAPGALVPNGISSINTGITGGQLTDLQFPNQPSLTSNVPYWIGVMTDTSLQASTAVNSTHDSVQFVNTFSNGPPGEAPAVTTGQADLQMYGDFTTLDIYEPRTYVYTYVSAYGEESAPSPFTLVNGWSNGSWLVGLFNPPATQLGVTENVALIRLYRTVTGTGGQTTYYFVADISVGSSDPDAMAAVASDVPACLPPSATYTDNSNDAVVALNNQLPSTNYFKPPKNLQGIMALPNGMYVGFVNNQVWFSEPYQPHAWPVGNVYTTDFPIVGLGYTGGSVVVLTTANPWVMTGVTPTQMSMTKCLLPEPCTSRGSILSTDANVLYISPNGLIAVTNSGQMTNVTELWITREKWAQLVPQKYGRAIPLASCYFCFGSVQNGDASVAQSGFNIEMDQDNESFTIWPQPGGHRVGFNLMSAPNTANITNVFIDPWTAYGLMIQNGAIYYWDFTDPAPTMMPFDWTSKIYQQNTKKQFEAFKVWFTVPTNTPPLIGARNTLPASDPSWLTLGAGQWLTVLIYADIGTTVTGGVGNPNTGDMVLVDAREIRRSGELLRIVDGFKAENWQFRLMGRVLVSNMQVATAAKELANV